MKELKKELNVSLEEKYAIILKVFSAIKPYSLLRNSEKEREVLVELFKIYNSNLALDENKRNRLVFDYYAIQDIAEKIGVSKNRLSIIITSLMEKGFVYRNENNKRMMNPKYVIPEDLEVITFKFKKEDNGESR